MADLDCHEQVGAMIVRSRCQHRRTKDGLQGEERLSPPSAAEPHLVGSARPEVQLGELSTVVLTVRLSFLFSVTGFLSNTCLYLSAAFLHQDSKNN